MVSIFLSVSKFIKYVKAMVNPINNTIFTGDWNGSITVAHLASWCKNTAIDARYSNSSNIKDANTRTVLNTIF